MNIIIRQRINKKFTRIYADIYYGVGKREYAPIGRLYPNENDENIRAHNERVKLKAINFVQEFSKLNNPYAFNSKSRYSINSNFLSYFEEYAEAKKLEGQQQYISSYKHFDAFVGKKVVRFSNISLDLVKAFHDYLFGQAEGRSRKRLANNTALAYFEKFSIVLNSAVDSHIIASNPVLKMKGRRKYIQPQRSYLTQAEIAKLEKLPLGEHAVLKRAFFFSCHTGLRFGDVLRLRIRDIYTIDGLKYACSIRINKTINPIALPLNKKAFNIIKSELGRNSGEKVFVGLKYDQSNIILKKWIKDAGIYKDITYHNSRHSFASNLINKNREILEVRDLLGHKSVKTTEIYAKTTGEQLRDAVESIAEDCDDF